MRGASKRSDRITLLAFASFWIVVAFEEWLGYTLVHAGGLWGSTASSPSAARATRRRSSGPQVPPLLTIARVLFAAQSQSLAQYCRQNLWTLIATRDVMPGRSVNFKTVTYCDFLCQFLRTAGYPRGGDITLINLKAPLIANRQPVAYEGMQFCGDPRFVQGLRFAGVRSKN